MQNVFINSSEIEKLAKDKYAVPQFLMMENAARSLADFVLTFSPENVVVLCGKGNNGGDGYAAARLLQEKCNVTVINLEDPTAHEAEGQYEMCRRLEVPVVQWDTEINSMIMKASVILDCIYGTGIHGELPESARNNSKIANNSKAVKIACDIPSGLEFRADYTITMGEQKLALYSDKAKAVCGKIILKDIGISREKLETVHVKYAYNNSDSYTYSPVAHLVDESDIKLPVRTDRAAHKGTYGHTAVFCGEKPGAAILAATAAMNFGSGLTSLIRNKDNDTLSQFKISPSLMLSDSIPEKTTAIIVGPGFTDFSENTADQIKTWASKQKSPAIVFDAGFLTAKPFLDFLGELNKDNKNARIILTPHLAEYSKLEKNCGHKAEADIESLANDPLVKLRLSSIFSSVFPNTTLIIKSANTFIASDRSTYIIANGPQSLAKGGSGDLLAGMAGSLLAQGYSAKEAAITAAYHHAQTALSIGEQAYDLTPERFLDLI